jgi:hypothetical protein
LAGDGERDDELGSPVLVRISIMAMIAFWDAFGSVIMRPMKLRRCCLSATCTAQSSKFPNTASGTLDSTLLLGIGRALSALIDSRVFQMRSVPLAVLTPSVSREDLANNESIDTPQMTSATPATALKWYKTWCESVRLPGTRLNVISTKYVRCGFKRLENRNEMIRVRRSVVLGMKRHIKFWKRLQPRGQRPQLMQLLSFHVSHSGIRGRLAQTLEAS